MPKMLTKYSALLVITLIAGCATNKPDQGGVAELVAKAHLPVKSLTAEQQAKYSAALTLLKSGDLSGAELSFKELSLLLPDASGVFANLGVIAEAQNDEPSAIEYYNKSLSLNPSNVVALNNLGAIHTRAGHFKEASKLYLTAFKNKPDNTSVLLNLAVLNELYLHDLNSAVKYYELYQARLASPDEIIAARISDLGRRAD